MGRFPAPLLMNTIHFGMQAVLSKAITWIWWERFHKDVHVTWRDYFSKGKPLLLNWVLVYKFLPFSLMNSKVAQLKIHPSP